MRAFCRAAALSAFLLAALTFAATRPVGAEGEKSLYERLGGISAIAAVADDFVDHLLKNKTVTGNSKAVEALNRVGVPALKYYLTEQIAAVSGGPQKYTG